MCAISQNTLVGIMTALEYMLRNGFQPTRTISQYPLQHFLVFLAPLKSNFPQSWRLVKTRRSADLVVHERWANISSRCMASMESP
jgi:hypothetical protein